MAHEDISELLKDGIQAAKDHNKAEARRLLEQVLEIDDSNEPAWMWLASVVDTPREKRICLENVLEVNPNNMRAREALAALGPAPASTGEPLRSTTPAGPASQPRSAAGAAIPTVRRRRLNPVVFIGGGALAIALIAIALFLLFNQVSAPASTPVPTVVAAEASVVAKNATTAPTLPPNGVIVTSAPAILPSFTPTATNTPNPSPTATLILPGLANYRIAYTDKDKNVLTMLGDGSQKAALFPSGSSPAHDVSFSRANKLTYVGTVDNNQQIFVADGNGQNATAITKFTGEYLSTPALSADGTKIAFVIADAGPTDDPATQEIYTINTDGSGMQEITRNGVEDRDPVWSPDGKQLIYADDPTGKKSLQLVLTDSAGNNPQQLTNSTGNNYSPAWSSDGKQIVFVSTRDRFENLYLMDLANPLNAQILTYQMAGASNRNPDWSVDGDYIVFASNQDSKVYNLYMITPDAKFLQKIAGQDDKSDSLTPHFMPE